MATGVTIVVPTKNGGQVFHECLEVIRSQAYSGDVQVIVIDSGSTDDTVLFARALNADVIEIPPRDFHHSRTRNHALRYANHDRVIFLVQDAVPIGNEWLSSLVESLGREVAAVYGRQVPRDNADLYARFEVDYFNNYLGREPVIQSIASMGSLDGMPYDDALRTIRFDNVCSIYRKEILAEVPFPEVPYGEDIAWAKTVMIRGDKVKYDPGVAVVHSHTRPAEYRMRRAAVEAVTCMRVLNRVKDDLSFVSVEDLESLADQLKSLKVAYLEHPASYLNSQGSPRRKRSRVVRWIYDIPLLRKLATNIMHIRNSQQNPLFVQNYVKAVSHHVEFITNYVLDSGLVQDPVELPLFIEQGIAAAHGRLIGEVYSSHVLSGRVPTELSGFVEPLLSGV